MLRLVEGTGQCFQLLIKAQRQLPKNLGFVEDFDGLELLPFEH